MEYADDFNDAPDLTAEARAAAAAFAATYLLDQYLPANDNLGLSFNFSTNDLPLADAASFRAFTTSADYGRTEGGSAVAGKLPPISRAFRIDEYDQLLLGGGDGIAEVEQKYARRTGISIAARVVKAQAEAIEYGRLTILERGLGLSVDYGRHVDLTAVVSRVFTAADSTPIDDLLTFDQAYLAINGQLPGVHLMQPRVLNVMSKNPDIIKAALPGAASTVSRVSVDDVRSVLETYGVRGVRTYDEVIDRVPVFSPNAVIALPVSGSLALDDGPLGTTEWGIPAEALQPKFGIGGTDRPGVFAAAFNAHNPERREVLGSAIVLPAVKNANATGRLQVLA